MALVRRIFSRPKPKVLKLVGQSMTLAEALRDENNILLRLTYYDKMYEFITKFLASEDEILDIVVQHLSLDRSSLSVSDALDWKWGSFNLCIPIHAKEPNRLMFRIPLPHKIGEENYPGNVDEKLRVEVATYMYLQKHCPKIPIPQLWGFGLKNGKSFSPLTGEKFSTTLNTGYILIDYIQNGQMLSESFYTSQNNPRRRHNLFKDLSKILAELVKIQHPRIGSFTVDDDGILTLSNRPLTLELHTFENAAVPTNIGRESTYTSTSSYFLDLLATHDSRLKYQPNSVNDKGDAHRQMAAISIMRAVMPHYLDRSTEHGPFTLQLTDAHPSNIFVDDDWKIISLVDLEWVCTRPTEMLSPPYWISGRDVDLLTSDNLVEFKVMHEEFVNILAEEERRVELGFNASKIMQDNLTRGSFWYHYALDSPKGFYNLFKSHIYPCYGLKKDFRRFSRTWCPDHKAFVKSKLQDRASYLKTLKQRAIFEEDDQEI